MKLNYKNKAMLMGIIGIVYTLISLTGCKKLVEIDPPRNAVINSDTFSSDAQAYPALAGMYSQMMSNSGSMVFSNGAASIYGGMSGDEISSNAGIINLLDYQFESNKLLQENTSVDALYWKPAYKVIESANSIIEGVAASKASLLTDSARTQLVGEAKFLRAFSYFYLTNFFGNVPLVLSTDFNKTAVLPNATQAAIYAQITQDLNDAQSSLKPDIWTGSVVGTNERIRANKWAATALLARVYLYQKRWADAEAQATAVIGNSHYSLTTLATVFNKNSNEAILQLQQSPTVSPYVSTFEGMNFLPSLVLSTQTPATIATVIATPATFTSYALLFMPSYYMTPQLASSFETNDQRKTVWTGYVPTPAAAPYNSVPIYYPNKYNLKSSVTTPASITQYNMVLRLGEQYLIRAEARAQQNNTNGAATDLNVIRTRAGLPNTTATLQADLLTAIMRERRIELFSEWGHRFFDLKRTGQADAVLGAIATKQPWNTYQLLYPIPPNDLKNDAFLQQNPGY
jgi:hypothetical protein